MVNGGGLSRLCLDAVLGKIRLALGDWRGLPHLPHGIADRLDNEVPANGNRSFQYARLTRETKLPTPVAVPWTPDQKAEPAMVALITHQLAWRARLRESTRRMRIAQRFRNDKSGGFDLEPTP